MRRTDDLEQKVQTTPNQQGEKESGDPTVDVIKAYIRSRAVHIILTLFGTVALSVGITTFVFLTYFYRPVVVIDLKDIVSHMQAKSQRMDKDEAIKMVSSYFDEMTKSLKSRKELVLVKEAVLNAEQFTDITPEYKK